MADELTDDQARLLGLPPHHKPPMSDQEIRARALECASRLPATLGGMKPSNAMETMFWETVHDFEAYIRDGVM